MIEQKFQRMVELMKTREEKRYAFLRHLLLLASGSLTILASFRADIPGSTMGRLFLEGAWIALGFGILLGGVSLHGEVWLAAELAKHYQEYLKARLCDGDDPPYAKSAKLPARYRLAQRAFYGALVLAVVCLVGYGLSRLKP